MSVLRGGAQRFEGDPHVWATTLFDELVGLGFDRSYQTFTRKLRDRELRPHCEPCASSNGRAHVDGVPSSGQGNNSAARSAVPGDS